MIVDVARFGKRRTTKSFDLERETDIVKFKVYMKNQKMFTKTILNNYKIDSYVIIIHAHRTREEKLKAISKYGKCAPIDSPYTDSFAPILLGY